MMLYASAATGFRPPGVSPRPVTVNQLTPFDSEELTAYEVGLKSEFNNRLRLNLAAFSSDYDKRLTSVAAFECLGVPNPTPTFDPSSCPSGSVIWFIYTTNPAEVQGVEAELTAEPIDGLMFNASLGWIDFESSVTDPTARGYRHPDNLVQPEWNASAGVQYTMPLASAATLTARLDWFYQDELSSGRNAAAAPAPLYTIDEISVVNGRLTFESLDRNWRMSLAVTNLLDDYYYYNKFSGSGFAVSGQPGRPREWAITIGRDFGN
jgi:iron complex outermembrane receptor protein